MKTDMERKKKADDMINEWVRKHLKDHQVDLQNVVCPECGGICTPDKIWRSRWYCPKHGWFDLSG